MGRAADKGAKLAGGEDEKEDESGKNTKILSKRRRFRNYPGC